MMSVSSSTLVVVESTGTTGMQAEAFKDRLHAVCCMLNRGDIGGGVGGYGCAEHVAALDAVEKHIAEVIQNIAEQNDEAPLKIGGSGVDPYS